MAYIALYRKWRPQVFSELVGQEHISRTLSNAIEAGRIGHAYLFAGPRGTGKTSTAKIFAKAINCEQGPTPEPCGKCKACLAVQEGTGGDINEIDAASNRGIDEIRNLKEKIILGSGSGIRYRVYIIDEVHMLTTEAFNALLKMLEEPPEGVVFILATTEAHKVPATIQSRCQRFDFRRITPEEIEDRLAFVSEESGIEAEAAALALIARKADGGMRDALSLLDQCSALSDGKVTAESVRTILGLVGHDWIYAMTDKMAAHDVQGILTELAELLSQGKDLKQILTELALHFRSLMIYQAAGTLDGLDLYAEDGEVLARQVPLFPRETVMRIVTHLGEAQDELRWSPQPRIAVELALLSCLRDDGAEDAVSSRVPVGNRGGAGTSSGAEASRIAALEAKLARLESAVAGGRTVSPAQPQGLSMPRAASQAGGQEARNPVSAKTVSYQENGEDTAHIKVAESTAADGGKSAMAAAGMGESSAGAPVPDIDGAVVWASVLQDLKSKPVLYSYLQYATFLDMTATRYRLHFNNSFFCGLMSEGPTAQVEALLREKTGLDLRVEKVSDEPEAGSRVMLRPETAGRKPRMAAKKLAKAEKAPTKGVDLATLPEKDRKVLKTAFDVFGDVERVETIGEDDGGSEPPQDIPFPGDSDAPPPGDEDAPPPDDGDAPNLDDTEPF